VASVQMVTDVCNNCGTLYGISANQPHKQPTSACGSGLAHETRCKIVTDAAVSIRMMDTHF